MLNVITLFSDTNAFIPHGHCYLWKPELVSLHLLSDGLIALAYYSMPLTLFYFVRKRRDLPFSWLFLLFSAFIVACGTTHLIAIWTLWHPTYWLSGGIKLLTACVSVATAALLVPIVPQALAMPSPSQLEQANQALQQEIAERQRIQAELTRSRDLREAIFNEAADALFLVDPQSLLTLDCNRRAVELFQAEAKARLIGIEGHTLQRTPFTQEQLSANVAEMQLQGFWSREIEYVTCRGNRFWGNIAAKLIVVAERMMYLVRVTDITERKQAETTIQQSEAHYRAIVEDQTEFIIRFQPDGTLTFVNDAFCRYLGSRQEDLVGHPFEPMIFAEDRDRVDQQLHVMSLNHATVVMAHRVVARGEVRWTQWVNRALFDPQGQMVEVQAVGRDIHDLKQSEDNLRQSKERLQLALEASGDGLWDWDIQAETVYRNPRYFEMLGYEVDDLPSQAVSTWEQLVHPEDVVGVKKLLAAYVWEGADSYSVDYRLRTKTGTWKWIADYGKVVARDEQGNPLRMIGTHRDIDDRKQAEQSLQEQEAFLRAIGDNIPNGYIYQLMRELDGRYHYTYVSAGIERVSGLKPDDILADSSLMFKLVVEEDLPYVLQKGEESAQNLSVFDIQIRERLTNGENRWLRLCSTPRRLEDGRVVWDGIRLDINDLKQTEETLRQSEARWQLAVSGSNDGIWDHNLRTNEHYLSPRCLEILGYEFDEVDTFDKWVQYIHPDDAPRLKATFQAHIDHRLSTNYACEYRMRCKDGSTKWLLARGQVLWDEQETPLRAVGSLTDINDRKQIEAALRQSEAKNRAMLAAIPDLLMRVKRDGTCLDCIPPTAPQAGVFLPVERHISEVLPAALLQKQLQQIEQALATGELQIWEHQLVKNGEPCDEEIRLVACGDDEVLLIVRDISARKCAEAALRQSEARNRALIQALPDLLIRMKQDGTYLDIKQTETVRLFNPGQMFVGNNIHAILPAEIVQTRMEYVQRALQTRALQVYEYQLNIDGALQFEEVRIVPCAEDEVLFIVRDVTDRKQTEESLRRYERIISATTDAISLLDRNYVYQVVNQSYLDWYNKPQDEIVGHPVSEFLPLDVYQTVIKPRLDQCLAGRTIQYEMWVDYITQRPQFLSVTYDPYYDSDRSIVGIVVSLRNITRLKQAEVELELQSLIARNMAEGVCMVRVSDGAFVYANPKFERMFGFSAGELIGQHVSIVNYEDRNTRTTEVYDALANAILEQGRVTYEVHNAKKDGTPFWCQATTTFFEHPTFGAVFVVVQQDITERKRTERFIQASLREKEVLLKEIHHRVKNNLGIVDGLLQMQSRRSSEPQVIATLQESQNRIASIALVHEKLYGSDDLANIDFAQYITDLTTHLFDSYNIYANRVKLTMQIEPIALDLDTAIPCGLIINELVSNALKYAFPNTQGGEIRVSFQQQHNHIILFSVSDNGIGLPPDLSLKQTKTLGITLVRGLVKQLQGTLEMNAQSGTTFIISFGRP